MNSSIVIKQPEKSEKNDIVYSDSFLEHEDNLYESEPEKLENESSKFI